MSKIDSDNWASLTRGKKNRKEILEKLFLGKSKLITDSFPEDFAVVGTDRPLSSLLSDARALVSYFECLISLNTNHLSRFFCFFLLHRKEKSSCDRMFVAKNLVLCLLPCVLLPFVGSENLLSAGGEYSGIGSAPIEVTCTSSPIARSL